MRTLAFLLGIVPAIAAAQTCTTGEYAQYKDKAATQAGLESMANDYCMALGLAQVDIKRQRGLVGTGRPLNFRAADVCLSEVQKMSDAAAAAGKGPEFVALTKVNRVCQVIPDPPR